MKEKTTRISVSYRETVNDVKKRKAGDKCLRQTGRNENE